MSRASSVFGFSQRAVSHDISVFGLPVRTQVSFRSPLSSAAAAAAAAADEDDDPRTPPLGDAVVPASSAPSRAASSSSAPTATLDAGSDSAPTRVPSLDSIADPDGPVALAMSQSPTCAPFHSLVLTSLPTSPIATRSVYGTVRARDGLLLLSDGDASHVVSATAVVRVRAADNVLTADESGDLLLFGLPNVVFLELLMKDDSIVPPPLCPDVAPAAFDEALSDIDSRILRWTNLLKSVSSTAPLLWNFRKPAVQFLLRAREELSSACRSRARFAAAVDPPEDFAKNVLSPLGYTSLPTSIRDDLIADAKTRLSDLRKEMWSRYRDAANTYYRDRVDYWLTTRRWVPDLLKEIRSLLFAFRENVAPAMSDVKDCLPLLAQLDHAVGVFVPLFDLWLAIFFRAEDKKRFHQALHRFSQNYDKEHPDPPLAASDSPSAEVLSIEQIVRREVSEQISAFNPPAAAATPASAALVGTAPPIPPRPAFVPVPPSRVPPPPASVPFLGASSAGTGKKGGQQRRRFNKPSAPQSQQSKDASSTSDESTPTSSRTSTRPRSSSGGSSARLSSPRDAGSSAATGSSNAGHGLLAPPVISSPATSKDSSHASSTKPTSDRILRSSVHESSVVVSGSSAGNKNPVSAKPAAKPAGRQH